MSQSTATTTTRAATSSSATTAEPSQDDEESQMMLEKKAKTDDPELAGSKPPGAGAAVAVQPQAQFFNLLGLRVEKKWVALVLLTLQTTALVLVMRYSRTAGDAATRYLSSTAVVLSESLKIVISVFCLRGLKDSWRAVGAELSSELRHVDTLKMAVPGFLYLVQNNLLYIALTNLDAAVYQVTIQLKVLTAAFFSVAMLGTTLETPQIVSLILLTGGIGMVQYAEQVTTSSSSTTPAQPTKVHTSGENENAAVGLLAVIMATLTSGFAGVYLEKVLKKDRPVSIWMRNVQLGIFGTIFGLGVVFASNDREIVLAEGFLRGYNEIVWIVVLLQAAGGLIVAAVIMYADNILKGFATSLSIIIASVVSVYLFSFQITGYFVLGASLVVAAIFLFSRGAKKK